MEPTQIAATVLILLGLVTLGGYGWFVAQPWSGGGDCGTAPSAVQRLCQGSASVGAGSLAVVLLLGAMTLLIVGGSIALAEKLKSS